MLSRVLLATSIALGAISTGLAGSPDTTTAAAVTQQRFNNADKEPGQWMGVGRTWSEQRFSPLKLIDDTNVQRLGLEWMAPLSTYR